MRKNMPARAASPLNRREMLAASGLLAGGSLVTRPTLATEAQKTVQPFRFCLNMSTIRGQELTVEREVDVAGEAGYDAIEPWLGKLGAYVESGGKLADLRQRIQDNGLTVESAIGFAPWIVDDDTQRAQGFETAKRDMDTLAQLDGIRIAAPPAGAPRENPVDPMRAAERYRQLLELGDEMGVVPQVEMWGGNTSIGRVSTAITIAIECGHEKACFLGDVYHTYKGGCDFDGLRMLGPQALQHFHMNDYPADPPRATIRDEHRVYPGDGVAPISEILRGFRAVGATPVLSLEVFNKTYWQQDALEVAKTGLRKMRDSVAMAGV
jgi:2-keto-myo-inositol isomerase